MPDPSYPCNRHFVAAADGVPVLLPAGPSSASSSMPPASRLWARARAACCWPALQPHRHLDRPRGDGPHRARGARRFHPSSTRSTSASATTIAIGSSALGMHGEGTSSPSTASKYFSMTGWRLGWMVVPPALVPAAIEKLAQNLFICASTIAQRAALACFEPESIAEYERRRRVQGAPRRGGAGLNAMGLTVPVMPDGAFYAWADCHARGQQLGFRLDTMRRAHVALTLARLRPPRRRALGAAVVCQLLGTVGGGHGGRASRRASSRRGDARHGAASILVRSCYEPGPAVVIHAWRSGLVCCRSDLFSSPFRGRTSRTASRPIPCRPPCRHRVRHPSVERHGTSARPPARRRCSPPTRKPRPTTRCPPSGTSAAMRSSTRSAPAAWARCTRAHDPLLSRLIAIKTLNLEIAPEEREAFNALFLNEARAAGGLGAPAHRHGVRRRRVSDQQRLHRDGAAQGPRPAPAAPGRLAVDAGAGRHHRATRRRRAGLRAQQRA